MLKQCLSHWTVGGFDDSDFKRVLEIGITGIEMPPADSYAKFRDMGFTIATICGHNSLGDGLNKLSNHARIVDELHANIEIAKQFEVPSLICFSGNRNGMSDEEALQNCAAALRQVAPSAEAAGVQLIPELLNSKVDHPDYGCDHTAWGVRLVEAVGSSNVKLLYDIYHMQIMEGDLIRTIQANINHIGHFHTAGNPGRHDLDDEQEINYPAVMRAIAALGYTGWVGHEFMAKGDKLTALQHAYNVCNVD